MSKIWGGSGGGGGGIKLIQGFESEQTNKCSDQIRAASQIRAEAVIWPVRLGQGLYPVI